MKNDDECFLSEQFREEKIKENVNRRNQRYNNDDNESFLQSNGHGGQSKTNEEKKTKEKII